MKAATVWEAQGPPQGEIGPWAAETWDGRMAMIVEWAKTEEEAKAYLKENHPDFPVIAWEEFQEGWRKDIGNPKARLFGDSKIAPVKYATASGQSTTVP